MIERSLYHIILEQFAYSFVSIESEGMTVDFQEVVLVETPSKNLCKKIMELFPEVVWC